MSKNLEVVTEAPHEVLMGKDRNLKKKTFRNRYIISLILAKPYNCHQVDCRREVSTVFSNPQERRVRFKGITCRRMSAKPSGKCFQKKDIPGSSRG